jgi:hypothetical protein
MMVHLAKVDGGIRVPSPRVQYHQLSIAALVKSVSDEVFIPFPVGRRGNRGPPLGQHSGEDEGSLKLSGRAQGSS